MEFIHMRMYANQGHSDRVQNYWANCLLNDALSDLTVIVGTENTIYRAHRFVLTAFSPYFTQNVVFLTSVEPKIFSALLSFCYLGHCHLFKDDVSLFVHTARELGFKGIEMSPNTSIKPLENIDRASPKWNVALLQKRPEVVDEVDLGANGPVVASVTSEADAAKSLQSEEERLKENIDRKFVLTGLSQSKTDMTKVRLSDKKSPSQETTQRSGEAEVKTETASSDVEDDPIEFEVIDDDDSPGSREAKVEKNEENASEGTVSLGSPPSTSRQESPTFDEDELDLDDDEDEEEGDLGEVKDEVDDFDDSVEVVDNPSSSVIASKEPVYSVSESQQKILSVSALASSKPADPVKEPVFKQTKSEVIVVYDKDFKPRANQARVRVNENAPGTKVIRLEVRQNETSAKRAKLQP